MVTIVLVNTLTDIIRALTARIVELETKVHHLEPEPQPMAFFATAPQHPLPPQYPPVPLPSIDEEEDIEIIVISDDEEEMSIGELIAEEQQEEMEAQMEIDEEMSDFIENDIDYPEESWIQEESEDEGLFADDPEFLF